MRCRALFLLPKLPLYSCWVMLYLCCIVLYSCCVVLYSCCVVLYSCCVVLCRVVSCCTRVVSCCTRVFSCCLVLYSCCVVLYSCCVVLSRVVTHVVFYTRSILLAVRLIKSYLTQLILNCLILNYFKLFSLIWITNSLSKTLNYDGLWENKKLSDWNR